MLSNYLGVFFPSFLLWVFFYSALTTFLPCSPSSFLLLFLIFLPSTYPLGFFPYRMLQPVSKQEGRTVVVVNSPRTPLGSGPFRPPLGPELSAQPTLSPTSPMLPAPLMMSASTAGPPLVPVSRPPGSVLLPPLQSNSGPLSQGKLKRIQR